MTGRKQTRYEAALADALQHHDVEDQIRTMERHGIARGEAMELLEAESFTEGQ